MVLSVRLPTLTFTFDSSGQQKSLAIPMRQVVAYSQEDALFILSVRSHDMKTGSEATTYSFAVMGGGNVEEAIMEQAMFGGYTSPSPAEPSDGPRALFVVPGHAAPAEETEALGVERMESSADCPSSEEQPPSVPPRPSLALRKTQEARDNVGFGDPVTPRQRSNAWVPAFFASPPPKGLIAEGPVQYAELALGPGTGRLPARRIPTLYSEVDFSRTQALRVVHRTPSTRSEGRVIMRHASTRQAAPSRLDRVWPSRVPTSRSEQVGVSAMRSRVQSLNAHPDPQNASG